MAHMLKPAMDKAKGLGMLGLAGAMIVKGLSEDEKE